MRAMTLVELVICMAILALCLVAMVRGLGHWQTMERRGDNDSALTSAIEAKLIALEDAEPQEESGTLIDGWRYAARIEDGRYVLEVREEGRETTYDFLIREEPT